MVEKQQGRELSAEQRRRQRRITSAIARIDLALPGSVEVRRTRCGKANCRCHSDDEARHGPYLVWTRKVNARTVTKVLSNEDLKDYQGWLDNARRLRELVDELHKLTLEVVEGSEGRSRPQPNTRPMTPVNRRRPAKAAGRQK